MLTWTCTHRSGGPQAPPAPPAGGFTLKQVEKVAREASVVWLVLVADRHQRAKPVCRVRHTGRRGEVRPSRVGAARLRGRVA
jgi:hypothetical protein